MHLNGNRNLHISKIWFLFPVSFTIEYKVGIAEVYLNMGFGADLLKNVASNNNNTIIHSFLYRHKVVTSEAVEEPEEPENLPKSESAHL